MNNIPIRYFVYLLAAVLTLPALFINLGLMPFIEDEAIRALVGLEMFIKQDFFNPTIGGEPYLKKPPLYNWIICGFYTLGNQHNEFMVRLPMILSLLLFCVIIFILLRKKTGNFNALFIALAFLTSGRILTYESQKGLIDILFSLIIFLNIHFIYQLTLGTKKGLYFMLSYFACSIAFMLKGLPAISFQVFTILVLFIYTRKIRLLFSGWHFAGVGLFIFIVGGYYLLYINKTNSNLNQVITLLFTETTRRTVIRFGIFTTIKHIFTFPFEFLFWFFPWTIFVLSLFYKGICIGIFRNPYYRFIIFVFLANIPVYWTSPEVHGRYVLMFVPLFYTIAFTGYQMLPENAFIRKIIHYLLAGFGVVILLVFTGVFFHPVSKLVELSYIKATLIVFILLVLLILALRRINYISPILILVLLVTRVGFNWFVLPYRYSESHNLHDKNMASEVLRHTKGYPLYSYWPADKKPDEYYGKRIINYATMFYITSGRKEILKSESTLINNSFYLIRKQDIGHIKVPYSKIRNFSVYNNHCFLIVLNESR